MPDNDSQSISPMLVTPGLWAAMVRAQAAEVLGTPEAAALLAEAKRYEACEQELQRLNRALQYEQHRAERIGTHSPGCHRWGPAHYECALRLLDSLTAQLSRLSCDADALLGPSTDNVFTFDRLSKIAKFVEALRDTLAEAKTGEPHVDGWPLYSGLPNSDTKRREEGRPA